MISGPCFVQKSWFRTAQAIQNSRKMCSKNQWISDVKVLKTCVLAHSVCICWLSGFVSWAWRTHNSLVKTNVLRRRVFFASPATGFCFGGVFTLCCQNASLYSRLPVRVNKSVLLDSHLHCHCLTYTNSKGEVECKLAGTASLISFQIESMVPVWACRAGRAPRLTTRTNTPLLEVTRRRLACGKLQEER